MAWFASPVDRSSDPKTALLAAALDLNRFEVLGRLDCLYGWMARYAPDGDLAPYSDEQIAGACEWTGDPARLVMALLDAGVLTPDATIAGWDGIYGPSVQRREDRARYARSQRARARLPAVDSASTPPLTPRRHDVDTTVDTTSTPRAVDAPSPPDPHSPGRSPTGTVPTAPTGPSGPPGDRPDVPAAVISRPAPVARAREARPTAVQVRLARIVDMVRAAGCDIFPSSRDGTALKSCGAPADRIAEAYVAAARGEWDPGGDGWLGGNLSVHLVISRLAGYRPRRGGGDFLETRYGRLRDPMEARASLDTASMGTLRPVDPVDEGAVAF